MDEMLLNDLEIFFAHICCENPFKPPEEFQSLKQIIPKQ